MKILIVVFGFFFLGFLLYYLIFAYARYESQNAIPTPTPSVLITTPTPSVLITTPTPNN